MRVKIEDVAKRAGVSIATVSLALNGNEKVNAKTRDKVVAIAREMGYRPNPAAKRLAMRKSRQIGLVVPDIENIYYAKLAQHTLNELHASNYALTISTSMNSRQMERRIIYDMIGNQVEGLLIAPVEKPNSNVEYLEDLHRAHIPFVFVTANYPNLKHHCVMCDLYGGMKQLLETLYAQGYRPKYLENYVLNAIVNHANYMQRQSKISEDEMIHNIIYKNYKNTKTRNRFNILSNYLPSLSKPSKFVNKYKIKEAVKNINNELEDAQREFDKLFKVDKEYE